MENYATASKWKDFRTLSLSKSQRSVVAMALGVLGFILLNILANDSAWYNGIAIFSLVVLLIACIYSESIFLSIKKYRKVRKSRKK